MAQLSDDCFAFGGPMLSIDEALALVRQRLDSVVEIETVPLSAGLGRVLAQDIVALVSVPSFDNSAVDGYAVRHCDLNPSGETVFPIAARLPAGAQRVAAMVPGTAARIFTGAPMPEGADTVFMQEDVRIEGENVICPKGLKPGANRRFAGEDFMAGSVVLPKGRRLDPRGLAALAAVGVAEAPVFRRLRVALFSTGDELVPPGQPLRPGAQYDSNRTLLAALLQLRGVEVQDLGILGDDLGMTMTALERAAQTHDLILTSGGVSTGEEDHVKQAVEKLGKLNFWRLAVKPGRPVALGTIGTAVFVGLPGNPVASFVTFTRLAGPLVDHLGGAETVHPLAVPAVAEFSYRKKAGRREYVRAEIISQDGGAIRVRNYAVEGAALISSLIRTDGLVELDEQTTKIEPGMPVRFLPYPVLY
jgi:molybdopterin molybdotransferase